MEPPGVSSSVDSRVDGEMPSLPSWELLKIGLMPNCARTKGGGEGESRREGGKERRHQGTGDTREDAQNREKKRTELPHNQLTMTGENGWTGGGDSTLQGMWFLGKMERKNTAYYR